MCCYALSLLVYLAGKNGPRIPLPDHVSIVEPKEEVVHAEPHSENKLNNKEIAGATTPAAPAAVPTATGAPMPATLIPGVAGM